VDFASLAGDTTNYISIEIYDIAGNTTTIVDAFRVLKDTTSPSYVNWETGGDLVWRNTGRNYNVDFEDFASNLAGAEYEAWTGANKTGEQKIALTAIPGVSGNSFTSDWPVDFASLAGDATNYISIEFYDVSGNTTTISDAFFILKDTTSPSLVSLLSPLDGVKTNSQFWFFDWTNSSDTGGGISNYEMEIATSTDFTTIAYSSSPEVSHASFGLLAENTYYWRVRAKDIAGNFSYYSSTRTFTIDLTSPSIIDNQTGDNIWRNTNSGIYNVDFEDLGGGLLSKFQVKATTGPNQSGEIVVDWYDVATNINLQLYDSNWGIPAFVFDSIQSGVTAYVSVRAYDNVGNIGEQNDVFYILKDTVSIFIVDNQAGDDVWHKINPGSVYNVSFNDIGGSLIDTIEYSAWTGTNQTGLNTIPWTTISSGPANIQNFSSLWGVSDSSWTALSQGFNYISVRAWNIAGTTSTLNDVFYIKKDTTTPNVADNQSGDDVWRKSAGTLYNVDFNDTGGSLINGIEYAIYSNPGMSGTLRKDWTPIIQPPLGASSYTQDWSVDFTALSEGETTNYISVRVWDIAGSTTTIFDVFYINKDITLPSISDNQPGDDVWRSSSGTVYDVDFNDFGGSLLDYAEVKITTGTGQSGTLISDWTTFLSNISSTSYSQDWALSSSLWDALAGGINYISVRVYDKAGNTQTYGDIFYIKKDTVAPTIEDNQTGDAIWRASSGLYNVDFNDIGGSLLNKVQVKITTGLNQTGTLIVDWSDVLTGINSYSYSSDWAIPSSIWDLLPNGTSYISVRVYDNSGLSADKVDAFYVLKDTSVPVIIDNQIGDDTWRRFGGTLYDIDFVDNGAGLSGARYEAWTGSGKTGIQKIPPTEISGVSGTSFTTNWSIDFTLLEQGTNYISIEVYDKLGSTATLIDAFYVKKDNVSPTISDNQIGDYTWRNSSGTLYDVDFQDLTSLLATAQYTIYSAPSFGGNLIVAWSDISSNLNVSSYVDPWSLASNHWDLLPAGTSYVSVRVYDNSGNLSQINDVFFIQKDTQNPSVDLTLINSTSDINGAYYGPYALDPGSVFDVDFYDQGYSKIKNPQYAIYSGASLGGTQVKDWTNITLNAGSTYYTSNWRVDFSSLLKEPSTNYISVRVFDNAGNYSTIVDAFRIFRSSSNAPEVFDNQEGDDVWRNANSGFYDVDFSSNSDYQLDWFEAQAWSETGQLGDLIANWTTVQIELNTNNYTTNWQLPTSFFDSLREGRNYISVRVYDKATPHNVSSREEVFYVNKDTTAPSIPILSMPQGVNLNYPDIIFDWADSNALASGTSNYELLVATSNDFTTINYSSNPADSQSLNTFAENIYYWKVRAKDNAENFSQWTSTAWFRVDLTTPIITDSQGDATYYQTLNTGLYNVDFSDLGGSLLSKFQIKAMTGANQTGDLIFDWSDNTTILIQFPFLPIGL